MSIRKFEGMTPQIDPTALVDASAVIIGDVTIGADSSVWPLTSIRGDVMDVKIGQRTNVQDNSVLHTTSDSHFVPGGNRLIIGDDVTIGHGCVIHACTIENLCLIGMGSVLLDKCRVCQGAMVGANSLVPPNKELDGGYLWVGSPVKKARELNTAEKEFLQFSADNYVALMKRYKLDS